MIRFSRSDSLVNSDVLPPTGDLISHLKSIFVLKIILNISIQCLFKMAKCVLSLIDWLKCTIWLKRCTLLENKMALLKGKNLI